MSAVANPRHPRHGGTRSAAGAASERPGRLSTGQPALRVIAGVGLAIFSGILIGAAIHSVLRIGTCSSTGYSAHYGPVPTCPSGSGWVFALIFGGVFGTLIGAALAANMALVFAGIFGGIGAGAVSTVFASGTSSGDKLFGAIFGGCFGIVGVIATGAAVASIFGSLRSPSPTPGNTGNTPVTPMAPVTATAGDLLPGMRAALQTATSSTAGPVVRSSPARPGRPAAPGSSDPLDELNRLADLHQQGGITDDEFAAAKAKILGRI